jgi:hypothetical protein
MKEQLELLTPLLQGEIDNAFKALRSLYTVMHPHERFDDFNLWTYHVTSNPYKKTEYDLVPLIVACVRAIQAQEALDCGENENSHSLLLEALKYCKDAEAITPKYLYEIEVERVDVAKSGGLAKAELSKPVKNEVIRLLKEMSPPLGWRFKSDAIKAIKAPLVAFIRKNRISITESNIENTLAKWSTKDLEIKAAFESVISKK